VKLGRRVGDELDAVTLHSHASCRDTVNMVDRHAPCSCSIDLFSREDYRVGSGTLPDWKRGHRARLSVSVDRYREEQLVDGVFEASGRDSFGAWSLTRNGAFVRLTVEEDDLAIKAWVLRRAYLSSVVRGRDEATCGPYRGGCGCEVTIHDATLRSPTLRFDSSWWRALESVLYQRADGRMRRWELDGWAEDKDRRGVYWPASMFDRLIDWSSPSGPSVSTCKPLVLIGETSGLELSTSWKALSSA
jgi:hypothetical protein